MNPASGNAPLLPAAAVGTGAVDTPVDDARWQAAWDQRPLLLSMARSRVGWHEAEDVVSEALLRLQKAPDVPPAAVRSWLVTTTLRLCTDVHRAAARDQRRRQQLAGRASLSVPGPEEEVTDREQARWLAGQVQRLPDRQAVAIEMRSAGHEVSSIAGQLGVPYKAVESLLSRARRSLRGWAAVLVGCWALSRFVTKRTAQLHIAAAALCATAGFVGPVASSVSEHGRPAHPIAPGAVTSTVTYTTGGAIHL
ncbi:MAG TPA: sigma-70 family RNA polymerase sigma factor [Mycobacteriales bacterium]|nr:sigma-70 family RNA polymerase sigma factor [Mycobacteriales bacterium]